MMWQTNDLMKILGIQLPIIQAPMAGGATTIELVAAVSNAGGLGSLGAGYMSASDMREAIKSIRKLTDKPFAVNLFLPQEYKVASCEDIEQACKFIEEACVELNITIQPVQPPYTISFEEQMNVIVEEKIPIFSFIFGVPEKHWISQLKKNGTLLMGTATNVAEAQLLEAADIDMVVAQGSEAGGHRGTFIGKADDSLIGILSLLPAIIYHINLPVIAAGGIMDARGIIASLTLGAQAALMGTAFLSCVESGIHPKYKETLLTLTEDHTSLTTVFSGKMARGIRNKLIDRLSDHVEHILDYPIQNALTRVMRNEAAKQNCTDFMSMWAGQSAYLSQGLSASFFIKKLMQEIKAFTFSNLFIDESMRDTKAALIWITDILKNHHIPFQITGGLAARAYGATRPIHDIDIDIPDDKFDIVKREVLEFITYGPENFKNDKWDLLLMTLNYHSQIIDFSSAHNTKIFNPKTGLWQKVSVDLSEAVLKNIFGLQLPVIPRNVLLAYKKVLSRKEDILDVNEIETSSR